MEAFGGCRVLAQPLPFRTKSLSFCSSVTRLLSRSAQIFFQDFSLSPPYECFCFSPRLYSLFPLSHDFLYHISSFWWNLLCRSFLSAYSQAKILRLLSISKYKCVYSTLTFYLHFNWLLAFSVAPEKLCVSWDPNSSFQNLIDFTLPHFILYQTFS